MSHKNWLLGLFSAIDSKDVEGFVSHLAGDVVFQFGNNPAVAGRRQVGQSVAEFFTGVRALRHDIREHWHFGDGTLVCRGVVNYERYDGSTLTVPFANIIKLQEDKAADYRIYADISALFSG